MEALSVISTDRNKRFINILANNNISMGVCSFIKDLKAWQKGAILGFFYGWYVIIMVAYIRFPCLAVLFLFWTGPFLLAFAYPEGQFLLHFKVFILFSIIYSIYGAICMSFIKYLVNNKQISKKLVYTIFIIILIIVSIPFRF